MTVTAQLVKQLREKTGVGMMECKKALTETNGDMEKAILYLRERGMSRAAKKSARTTSEGMLFYHLDDKQERGVLLEVDCETDFVSKNSDFKEFGQQLARLAVEHNLASVAELLQATVDGRSAQDVLIDLISKIGENITVSKLQALAVKNGHVAGYIHLGGKLGTLVALRNASASAHAGLGKDLALHIIASAPRYLTADEVNSEEIEQEKSIAEKKLLQEGKPEKIIPKILAGQIKKFYNEVCLLQQSYVKEPKISVQEYLHQNAAQVEIAGFVRLQVGEQKA